MSHELRNAILELGSHIRYVASGEGQQVEIDQRAGLSSASDARSDYFEELFVNPALVTLLRQRGELDCGGLRHVVIGYGNFNQVVVPTSTGHVSVAVELDANAEEVAGNVAALLAARGIAVPVVANGLDEAPSP